MKEAEKKEQNKDDSKRCWGCGDYFPFYTKGYVHFNREKYGFCRKHQKIVRNRETCENWRNNYFRKRVLNRFSIKVLNNILSSLSEVTQAILDSERPDMLVNQTQEERILKECDINFLPDKE